MNKFYLIVILLFLGCAEPPKGRYDIYTLEVDAITRIPLAEEYTLYDTHYGEKPQIKKYPDKQVLCYNNQCIPFPLDTVITIVEE